MTPLDRRAGRPRRVSRTPCTRTTLTFGRHRTGPRRGHSDERGGGLRGRGLHGAWCPAPSVVILLVSLHWRWQEILVFFVSIGLAVAVRRTETTGDHSVEVCRRAPKMVPRRGERTTRSREGNQPSPSRGDSDAVGLPSGRAPDCVHAKRRSFQHIRTLSPRQCQTLVGTEHGLRTLMTK